MKTLCQANKWTLEKGENEILNTIFTLWLLYKLDSSISVSSEPDYQR